MISVSQSLIKDLEQQQQSMMMKKLLFAVCRNYWENDHTTLLSTGTEELISELCHSQPTLTHAKNELNRVVNRLNKREKYYPIANILLRKISKLYGEVLDEAQASLKSLETQELPMSVPPTESSRLAEVVQIFKHHHHSQRIHKMLFAVTKQRWENDLEALEHYPLKKLIKEVRQSHPDLERLSLTLLKIVKGLNKQATYSKIAEIILTEFAKLYNEEVELDKLKSLVNVSPQTGGKAKTTGGYSNPRFKVETQTRKPNFNYDPYPVRQRVMKYTNPLRVKMLLFYTLNPNQVNNQQQGDGLLLKTYELDKMLMQVVQKFKTIKDLQDHLETTALGISSIKSKMFNVDENLQVAKAIVMSLKPLYEAT